MAVARPWPTTAPLTTPTGDDAADRAIVAKKDLSPHSAAKTKAKVVKITLMVSSEKITRGDVSKGFDLMPLR